MSTAARLVRATAFAAVGLALLAPRGHIAPRHLILISLDTLRADHLGAYGYPKPTSPVFDQLARQGVLFEHAVAQGPATLPSHGALMTGQYPSAYGDDPNPFAVPAGVDTLAEVLQHHGFATWGFTDGGFLARTFGLGQGFDRYEDRRVGLARITQRIDRWLGTHHAARTFLFVHCYDVHSPYQSPVQDRLAVGAEPWRGATSIGAAQLDVLEAERPRLQPKGVAPLVSLYDADVRYTDRRLGELLDVLDRHGLLATALVVILSDHGEEFFEHGQTQHKQLFFRPNLHVPLLFVVPGRAPGRVATPVELIDVLPTTLALLNLPPHVPAMGRSLVTVMDASDDAVPAAAYAEGTVWTAHLRTLVTDRHQLLYDTKNHKAYLYDHRADPRAQRNLAKREAALTARLLTELEQRMDAAARHRTATLPAPDIDARTRRDLQALGYVE
jgi:arylsulfatase A-like enzyme